MAEGGAGAPFFEWRGDSARQWKFCSLLGIKEGWSWANDGP